MQQKQFEVKKIELDRRLEELELKVKNIEVRKTKTSGQVEILAAQLQTILAEHDELERKQLKEIAHLEPIHATNLSDFAENTTKLEHMKAHTIEMTTRIAEMNSSIKVMQKQTEKAQVETVKLT